jgi:hypothetical protein
MQIHIHYCRRTKECEYCRQPIALNEPEIVGQIWATFNSGTASEAHRYYTHFWHAKKLDGTCCWLESGLSAISQMEKKVETRGGKTLLLPSDVRKKRLQLLQRHARLVQMLKEEMEKLATDETTSNPQGSWERVALLGQRLEELKSYIEPLGGIPASWINSDIQSTRDCSSGLEQPVSDHSLALTGSSAVQN